MSGGHEVASSILVAPTTGGDMPYRQSPDHATGCCLSLDRFTILINRDKIFNDYDRIETFYHELCHASDSTLFAKKYTDGDNRKISAHKLCPLFNPRNNNIKNDFTYHLFRLLGFMHAMNYIATEFCRYKSAPHDIKFETKDEMLWYVKLFGLYVDMKKINLDNLEQIPAKITERLGITI